MKRILSAMVLAIISFVFVLNVVAVAQDDKIVTYEGDADASSKRPSFKGALVAVDYPGQVAIQTTSLFIHLGARRFITRNNPCDGTPPLVCARITVGAPMQSSSAGSISSYGGSHGYSVGGSFSGQNYPIALTVFLVVYDQDNPGVKKEVLLGRVSCLAPAGSGSSYSSSYGSRGGGMYSTNSSSGLDATIGNAVEQDLNALLLKGSWNVFAHPMRALNKFFSWGTPAEWVPGADETVKKAFAPPAAIPADPSAAPTTEATATTP